MRLHLFGGPLDGTTLEGDSVVPGRITAPDQQGRDTPYDCSGYMDAAKAMVFVWNPGYDFSQYSLLIQALDRTTPPGWSEKDDGDDDGGSDGDEPTPAPVSPSPVEVTA